MSYSGKFKDKNNNLHPVTSVLYGTCDTAAATAAKVVTCTDFDTLMTGVTIRVKFANANTAASPTVNINSTGAKSVYRFGSTAPVDGNSWNAGEVVELVYDGTSFFMTGADDIAAKQNATDNSLETEAKTIVGAINEHEGDVSTLKSGLTTLDDEVNGDATVYPYADVITIEDAVPANVADCKVKIEPVQDLHGQSAPYVGGASKNKLPLVLADIKANNTDGTWNDNVYTINNGTITVNTDDGGNVTGIKANGTFNATTAITLWAKSGTPYPFENTIYTLNGCTGGSENTYKLDMIYNTPAANILVVNFDNEASSRDFSVLSSATGVSARIVIYAGTLTNQMFYPMLRLATETDATFAPYTNICPISGHTQSVVSQGDGINQWNEEWESGTYNAETGEKEDNPIIIRSKGYISILPSTKYCTVAGYMQIFFYDESYNYLGNITNGGTEGSIQPYEITTNANAHYMTFRLASQYGTTYNNNISINYPSTITTYHPYAGKTYTIALGDTIYGGTVDFDSGVMTVDRAFVELDASVDEEWTAGSVNERAVFRCDNCTENHDNYYGSHSQWLSNIAVAIDSDSSMSSYTGQPNDWLIRGQGDISKNILVGTPLANKDMTLSDFKTMISTTPLQISYPLATPTTIQLTPQQIQLLKGQNTITASTGQISVTANGVSGSIGQVQEQVNDIAGDKQDKTDNTLQTTDKTVVGAVNELKSGLINVDVALSVPENSGKNVLPLTLEYLKSINTAETWNGNTYTRRDVVYTVNTDTAGKVTSITANGTASSESSLFLANNTYLKQLSGKSVIINGSNGGDASTYAIQANKYDGTTNISSYTGDSDAFIPTVDFNYVRIVVRSGANVSNKAFYPMLRLASVSDPIFAPYIPSVESRIEAVESLEKPSNIIAILTAGANVSASVLGVILPKDVQTATITRVIPLGGSGTDVNLPLTVTNYDYESLGVIDGSASAVGSDTLINIAREYCTQVNISLTY